MRGQPFHGLTGVDIWWYFSPPGHAIQDSKVFIKFSQQNFNKKQKHDGSSHPVFWYII